MTHKSNISIRFSDIDAFGHVNNATYLTYYEEARVRFFDDVVDWGYDWSKEGVILARAEVDYILPVHFKDEIFIHTFCSRIGNKSFDLSYQMVKYVDGKEILLSGATTVMVAFDYKTHQSIPVRSEWLEGLKKYSGS